MRGLELGDGTATAVSVDDGGRVLARAEARAADLADAAQQALDAVRGVEAGPVAIAALAPDDPAVGRVAERLAGTGISVLPPPAIPSGTAAVVAEAWVGAARGSQHAVYFGVGDHAAAGILRGGAPFAGPHRAPAVAWLALNPVERDDYRRTGCLEAETAAAGIVKRLIWRIKAGDQSRVQEAAGGDLSAITLTHILAGARAGDGVSISVIRDTAKYLGMAAANLATIADPEVLVLGGIMASSADLLFEAVRLEVGRRLPPELAASLSIVPAALGGDAAAIGAARIAELSRA